MHVIQWEIKMVAQSSHMVLLQALLTPAAVQWRQVNPPELSDGEESSLEDPLPLTTPFPSHLDPALFILEQQKIATRDNKTCNQGQTHQNSFPETTLLGKGAI